MSLTITVSATDTTEDERAIKAAICEAYRLGWEQAIEAASAPFARYIGPHQQLFRCVADGIRATKCPDNAP